MLYPLAVRTLYLILVLVALPFGEATGQGPCTPASTNGLRLFEAGSEIRFEPSAVVFLPGQCAVLAFSDKSEVVEAFRFAVDGSDLIGGDHLVPNDSPAVVQIEAVTRTADGTGVLVVTSGAFKGASNVEPSREDRALVLRQEESGAWGVDEDLSVPWERFLRGLRDELGGWLKVEGMASLGERYLVGIRQFGESSERFDYGLLIAVWDPEEPNVTTILADPRSTTFEEVGDRAGMQRMHMRTYGVSSLECGDEPGGRMTCYMLVSSESGPGVDDVKSRLLTLELNELANATSLPGRQVACFWNKAEGLTLLEGGMVLVVFDSDQIRKDSAGGTDRFPLLQNQDYYWMGNVDLAVDQAGPEAPNTSECVGP